MGRSGRTRARNEGAGRTLPCSSLVVYHLEQPQPKAAARAAPNANLTGRATRQRAEDIGHKPSMMCPPPDAR
jgi:hypothetical protein